MDQLGIAGAGKVARACESRRQIVSIAIAPKATGLQLTFRTLAIVFKRQ
jgi:hypothetical protein